MRAPLRKMARTEVHRAVWEGLRSLWELWAGLSPEPDRLSALGPLLLQQHFYPSDTGLKLNSVAAYRRITSQAGNLWRDGKQRGKRGS